MKKSIVCYCVLAVYGLTSLQAQENPKVNNDDDPNKVYPLGYTDTPFIKEGSKWRVHDLNRPLPEVVKPAEKINGAPSDAVVIFDGSNTDALHSKGGAPCPWKIENGELLVENGDCWSHAEFGDCQLHLEWWSAPETIGNSQKKGNGGVFFLDQFETQILDVYNNPTYADGHAGGVYGQTPPLVNAVHAPGHWQTYDIVFTIPRKEGDKIIPAKITSFINGICVQNATEYLGPTMHKKATNYDKYVFVEKGKLRFQDHKNKPPVRLRNIWVRPIKPLKD
jgi:Domain of Unknown Function (DUF1080)